jgi:serine protease AprX
LAVIALGLGSTLAAVLGVDHAQAVNPPALPHYFGPSTTGTAAIRSDAAHRDLRGADGMPLDGRGTSIAIVDTGVDTTHPAFALPDGSSKVVRSLSTLPCLVQEYTAATDPSCITDLPLIVDSDTGHGGHGTMVSGVAVGNPYTLTDGTHVGGVAPGARIVMLSATATLIAIQNAFAWVLQHHAAPCGTGVSATTCPPIRVLSCSWGANDATITKLEDQLAAAGVLTVWANGNQGGDGTTSNSNPSPSLDTTRGVMTVASFDDQGKGTRDGKVSASSSRGAAGKPVTWPAISAPGDNIISACRPYLAVCMAIGTGPKNGPAATDIGTYNTASGTSFSAPALAGVIAMLYQADPQATAADVDDAMRATAYKFRDGAPYRPLGKYSSSFDKGTGLVDAYAAALQLGATRQNDTAHTTPAAQPAGNGNGNGNGGATANAAVGLPNTAATTSDQRGIVAVLLAAGCLAIVRARRKQASPRSRR